MISRRVLLARWRDPIGAARAILAFAGLAGLAGLLIAGIDYAIILDQRSSYILKVPCYMEHSAVIREHGRGNRNLPGWQYEPVVRYRYEYEGEIHTSDVVSSRVRPPRSEAEREMFLEKYGPGSNAECLIDPDHPERSMLELPTSDGAKHKGLIGLLALLLALAGLTTLEVMLIVGKPPARKQPRAPGWGEIDSGRNDQLSRTRAILRERLES